MVLFDVEQCYDTEGSLESLEMVDHAVDRIPVPIGVPQ